MAPGVAVTAELQAMLAGPLGDAIGTAAAFADHALAASTERTYARDWRAFADWCRAQHVDPAVLPAHPVLVAAYLAGLVPAVGKSGLKVRLAAIAHHHHRHGHHWSANHPAIAATLRGILRQHGKPVRPAAALTSTEIRQLLASCGDNLAGLRDRALLLVGFAEAGLSIIIPRSKRDQEGQGATVTLPHGLRAGFITEAYLAAAPDEQVMAHTRHADVSTMHGYRRRAKITADNPARLLDL